MERERSVDGGGGLSEGDGEEARTEDNAVGATDIASASVAGNVRSSMRGIVRDVGDWGSCILMMIVWWEIPYRFIYHAMLPFS